MPIKKEKLDAIKGYREYQQKTKSSGTTISSGTVSDTESGRKPAKVKQEKLNAIPHYSSSGNIALDRSGKTRNEYDSSARRSYAARTDKLTEDEYNSSPSMQQKYGSYRNYTVGATADGRYYPRPTPGAEMERKYNTVSVYENSVRQRAQELQSANEAANSLYTKLNELSGKLSEAQQYANGGTMQWVQQEYADTLKRYREAEEKAQAAYAAYEPLWNRYKQASEDYEAYRTEQEDLLSSWKSTIRTDADAINADLTAAQESMAQLKAQQKELNKRAQALTNKINNRRGGTSQLTEWSRQAQELRAQAEALDSKIAEVQSAADLLQEELGWRQYYRYADLTKNADFAEKSKYVSTATGEEPTHSAWSNTYTNTGFADVNYDVINRNKDAVGRQRVNNVSTNLSFLGLDNSERGLMTDEEIAIFNYLYAQDTANGDAEHTTAYAYIDYLTNELTYRRRQKEEEQWAGYAKESPVSSSIFSILEAPMKGVSYLGQLADYMKDGKIDQNAGYNKFSYMNSAIRSEVANAIEQSGKWGKAGSFLYQTGMSMGDFLMTTALSGGFAGGGALSEGMALAIMGTGAAADTVIDAKDRGLTDGQAFALGTIAGAAEIITEKFSIETLLEGKWEKNAIEYILKNAAVEGSEEVGSDIINFIADVLIAKDKSEWQQSINAYKAQGMSDSEAFGHALGQQLASAGLDYLGGFLSGGTMASANVGIGKASQYAERRAEAKANAKNAAPGTGAADAGGIQANSQANNSANNLANAGAGGALRESTNVNDNPAQHTEAEQRVIEEYKNSVDPGLVEFYEAAKEQSTAKKGAQPYMLKPVSDRLAGAIEQLTGVNTSGFDTRLDVRQANHIYTDHGENGKADRTMADASDVGRLQYVIDNYDSIAPWGSTAAYWQPNGRGGNKQAKTVLLSKKVNGTYYVVEAAPDTAAKSVYVVSAYMLEQGKTPPGNANKIATGEIEQLNDAEMPRRNGQTATALDNPVADSTIPQPSPAVNTLENTRDGENGWGTRYNSAAEVLEAGMRELAPSLWQEYSGAEYTPQRDAIVGAVVRVGQDVGRGKVSPADALRYLERAYKGGGIEAIERIASTPGEKYAPRAGETVTLPTAKQELAERNGGNLNGQKRTEQVSGGQEGSGNALPDRSAGRDAGERAGGKADGMEARKGGRADAGRKAIERQNRGRRLPLERVSSRELGLKQGTENPNLKLLPEDAWDDGLRETAKRLEQETGRGVTYVLGGMEIEDADGETRTVRGVITQEQIIIQADCMSATAEQIGEHELFHYYADENPGLISSVREEITEKYGREEFDEIVGKYIERLRGIIDASESPFADAQDAVLEDIENEIFADAYAGINAFGAHAERYQGEVRAVTEQRGVTSRQTSEATERRTGPPAGEDEYLQLLREQLSSGEITDSEYDRLFDEYYQGGSEGRYSYAGERAQGADLDALKRAKEMQSEGVANDVIRRETGWYAGMDGKWRFEIDDSGMEFRREGDARLMQEPGYRRLKELTDKWGESVSGGAELTAAEEAEMERLQGEYSDAVWEEKYMLTDFLKHDALFEAYPQLRGVSLVFDSLDGGVKGYFSKRDNTIVLSDSLFGKDADTLIHEIQHVIQSAEGFSRGASPEYWNRRMEEGYSKRWDSSEEMMPSELYRNTAGEIEARDAASRRSLTAAERRERMPDLGDENTVFADEGGESYSINNTRGLTVREQMKKYRAGEMTSHDEFYYGESPSPLDTAGFDGRPLVMSQKDFRKSRSEKHNVPPRAMTRLTEALSDPVLSFEAGDKIGVLTKDIDGDGKPLLVGVLKNTELDGEIVNRIKSAYGLDDPQAWIKNQIAEGKTLRIYDNEKADSFLGEFGYKAERPKDYRSGDTIPNVHENVKYSAFNEEVARQLAGEAPGKTKFSAEDEGGGRGEHSTGGPGIRFSVSDEENSTERETQERGADAESVRTALPKKAQNYLRSTERTLVNRIGNALGVPKLARREYLDAIVKEISSEYLRSGRVSAESANRLFDRAYDEGIVVDEEFYRQYKDLKDRLRTMRVSISEKDRADIADFNSFRRSAFGTLNIANDGTPVDVAYQELNADAPELFPPEITRPADQLMRMFDAARSIQRTEKSLDEYYGHSAAEFRRWAKNDFDAAISDTLSELRNIKRYADEGARAKAEEPPATLEEVQEAYKQLREARKKYEKAMAKNLLTHDDEMQVGLLMRGETELQYISPRKYNVRGIRAVYEAKAEYEKYAGAIRKWNESRRAELKKIADTLLETANSWKDKRAGILYSRETMERNIRDIVKDKELADRIIAEYFTPVHKAQAESTRLKNRMRRKVDSLNLSTIETKAMKRDGRVSEAHAVQLFGEAMDNIQMLENSRGRIKTRDGKTLEEWRAAVTDLWTQNPQLDRAKIENAVEEFRKIYDELFAMMNESRLRNGYEPVNYRRGYFPHFQPGDGDGVMGMFGRALGIETQVTALPTTINGLTHTFRPGIQWFGNALERRGFETAYDAVEGFDRYVEGVADVIYQTDNIQKLRALATQVRYRTGDEGIKKQVDAVNADTTLSEEDRQSRIDKIYEDGRFALSNFAVELEEYTNLLANKKSRADRSMEQALGRRMYNIVKTLEGRVAANMVSVNIGSWLTNYIPLTQGWATLGRGELLRGMWQTLKNMKESDGIVDASTFLTNRRGSDPLVRSWSQRASATLSSPMEHIDQFTAGSLVRARYNQNLKRGMSESAAMDEADSWTAGVMADRSKGSTPTLFNRKNPITKLFTQFQLEVNNQLSYVFKDIPGEMKDKGLAALALALLKFCLGAWLYDEIYEYFVGRRPALDPIGILNDTVGDITGYELPNLVTLGVGAVTGDVPSFETEKAGVGDTLKNLGGNIAEQVPFVGGLMGGGRIPVSSALPDLGKLYDAATSDTWSTKKRLSTAGKEFSKPATYLVPPFGGGQIRKIYQGLKAVIEGGSYTVDNEGNKQLQYPVYTDTASDTVKSIVQSTLFGKTALPGGREWIDSGFKSLNAKQTAVYQGMLDVGVSQREAYRTVREISALKKTDTESAATVQRNYLDNSNLSGEGKSVVYYGLIASDKERETMDALADMGADMGAVTQALMDMKDEKKDADKLVVIADANFSGEEALALAGMVMGTELTNDNGSATQYAKLKACIDAGMDASDAIAAKAAGADLEKLLEFSDAGLDSDTALKAARAIAALEPEEGKENVSNVQKWRAAVDAGGTTEDQMNALKAVMTESHYGKLEIALSYGIEPESYVHLKEIMPDYDADGTGSLSGDELKKAIDSMGGNDLPSVGSLTREQQAVLWQLYSTAKSASNNPYNIAVGRKVLEEKNKKKEEEKNRKEEG